MLVSERDSSVRAMAGRERLVMTTPPTVVRARVTGEEDEPGGPDSRGLQAVLERSWQGPGFVC